MILNPFEWLERRRERAHRRRYLVAMIARNEHIAACWGDLDPVQAAECRAVAARHRVELATEYGGR